MSNVKLREVDKIEVTVIVDNYTDLFLLQSDRVMKRPSIAKKAESAPVAEHGLSLLIRVEAQGETQTILSDTGLTEMALMHNLKIMHVDPDTIDTIFLSHGHVDHFGGLIGLLRASSRTQEIIAHPAAFLPRRINIPNDDPVVMPILDKKILERADSVVRETPDATTFCSGTALALGEVERVTDFESGFGWAEVKEEEGWVKDPFRDDQGIVFNVKGKGLVVIGGCSHAGIINTVKYAQKAAGISDVYAVMGGFHLTGPMFEPIIQPTIDAMKELDPAFVMPMHCTGWKAINRFAQEMPDQFFLTSVGTSYVFQPSS
jgi:7,8-dihydropterin-6-yl-methyl-4-(beta-D-ribofuranosyl)aminobenzene 5'-phosphate synthase